MFSAMFSALKRIVDLSLLPMLLAVIAVFFEWWQGAITWLGIKLLSGLLTIATGLINKVPFPAVTIDDSVFGIGFLDFASILGIWPAITVWLLGGVAALITRLFTLGIIGNG